MRKGIKILGKVFSVAVLLLIILPMVLSLLLDIPAVQNYVVQKAVRMVSRKLETTVSQQQNRYREHLSQYFYTFAH